MDCGRRQFSRRFLAGKSGWPLRRGMLGAANMQATKKNARYSMRREKIIARYPQTTYAPSAFMQTHTSRQTLLLQPHKPSILSTKLFYPSRRTVVRPSQAPRRCHGPAHGRPKSLRCLFAHVPRFPRTVRAKNPGKHVDFGRCQSLRGPSTTEQE